MFHHPWLLNRELQFGSKPECIILKTFYLPHRKKWTSLVIILHCRARSQPSCTLRWNHSWVLLDNNRPHNSKVKEFPSKRKEFSIKKRRKKRKRKELPLSPNMDWYCFEYLIFKQNQFIDPWESELQSNLAIRNVLIRNKLALRNFLWITNPFIP